MIEWFIRKCSFQGMLTLVSTIVAACTYFQPTVGSTQTVVFDPCPNYEVGTGAVAALSKGEDGSPCWIRISNGEELAADKLAARNGRHEFSIVFLPSNSTVEYDAIYNVLVAERGVEPRRLEDSRITLLREAMQTRCPDGTYERLRLDYAGASYTRYHAADNNALRPSDPDLARFHVDFMNELEACVRSDSTAELRSRFLFVERNFQNPTRFARFFGELFGIEVQAAELSQYDTFSVRLRQARTGENFRIGVFSLPAGASYRITVSDLSLTGRDSAERPFLRIPPVRFTVEN